MRAAGGIFEIANGEIDFSGLRSRYADPSGSGTSLPMAGRGQTSFVTWIGPLTTCFRPRHSNVVTAGCKPSDQKTHDALTVSKCGVPARARSRADGAEAALGRLSIYASGFGVQCEWLCEYSFTNSRARSAVLAKNRGAFDAAFGQLLGSFRGEPAIGKRGRPEVYSCVSSLDFLDQAVRLHGA